MGISFNDNGWDDYIYWQNTDKKILKKINVLIKEIIREPFGGIDKPEALKNDLSGLYSRRIDKEHRIVYAVLEQEIVIIQCRYHY